MNMVCKCGCKEFFTEKHGNQTGLYCSACGKWQKWLKKDEIRLFNHDVQDGWISVKDRLPDTSRYVIGCFGGYVFECWYHTVDKHWIRHGIAIVENVTHWRELPDPPRKLKELNNANSI